MNSVKMKYYLLERVILVLKEELKRALNAAQKAKSGSTHDDAVARSKYETQATELSYLADGYAMRATELTSHIHILEKFYGNGLASASKVVMGSLVTIERHGGISTFFMLPVGAGTTVEYEELMIKVMSASAPLGAALMGARIDDEVQGAVVLHIV